MLDPNKLGSIALSETNSEKMRSENRLEGKKPLGTIGIFINHLNACCALVLKRLIAMQQLRDRMKEVARTPDTS